MMAFAIVANIARKRLKKKKSKKKKSLVGSALELREKGLKVKSDIRGGITDRLGVSAFDLHNQNRRNKKQKNLFGNL